MTDSKSEGRRGFARWWVIPDWLWQGFFFILAPWIFRRIRQRMQKIEFGQLRRVAYWLVNPRLLGIVLAIPSFGIAVITSNQLITNQASWGSITAQIMILSMLGLAMTAPLVFTPYRRRAYRRVSFKRSC